MVRRQLISLRSWAYFGLPLHKRWATIGLFRVRQSGAGYPEGVKGGRMMKVKVKLSSTRKFVLHLEEDTLGALKDNIRKFVEDTYKEQVNEPLTVSLNGSDVLPGSDDTRLRDLGVVPGDMLIVVTPAAPAPGTQQAAPQSPAPARIPQPSPERPQKPTSQPAPTHTMDGGSRTQGQEGERQGASTGAERRSRDASPGDQRGDLLLEAKDGAPPAALEQLLQECMPASLSGALNLVFHLTMLECGFHLDGVAHPPPGWGEAVAVFPYCNKSYPDFKCKLVLMDVGRVKQIMASFPEQAGEIKHSLTMEEHVREPPAALVTARDLVGVAQLARQLRDAVLHPLQVAAHQTLGVPAPWHLAGLPQEVLLMVAGRLDYRWVVALAGTCRRLRAVMEDNKLWRSLYKRDFPRSEGSTPGEQDWKGKYKEAVRRRKEWKKLQDEGLEYVIPGVYPTNPFQPPHFPSHPNPLLPQPRGPNPYPPQPHPQPNPFLDPDSPYFPGEIPPVPGVFPDLPYPLNPLGPLRPRPGHPLQPPFMPPTRPRSSGPRFDFF